MLRALSCCGALTPKSSSSVLDVLQRHRSSSPSLRSHADLPGRRPPYKRLEFLHCSHDATGAVFVCSRVEWACLSVAACLTSSPSPPSPPLPPPTGMTSTSASRWAPRSRASSSTARVWPATASRRSSTRCTVSASCHRDSPGEELVAGGGGMQLRGAERDSARAGDR